jgi:hypothetical protein
VICTGFCPGIAEGAVYKPVAEMVPAALLPPMVPPANQVRLPLPASPVAENWTVPPSGAEGIVGVSEMLAAAAEMALISKLPMRSIETVSDLNIDGGPPGGRDYFGSGTFKCLLMTQDMCLVAAGNGAGTALESH